MINKIDLGITHYNDCLSIQNEYVEKRISQDIVDTILFTEHYPCFTMGRKRDWNNIAVSKDFLQDNNISIIETNRGGDVTFHGIGQLVVYPIIQLNTKTFTISQYLTSLEETGIRMLDKWGIVARRKKGFTGIWVGDKKIASIGIGVKQTVTYHGIAINLNTDMKFFKWITPCGIQGVKMVSVKELLQRPIELSEAKKLFFQAFCSVINNEE